MGGETPSHCVKHNRIDLPERQDGAKMSTGKDCLTNEQVSQKKKKHFFRSGSGCWDALDRRSLLLRIPARDFINEGLGAE